MGLLFCTKKDTVSHEYKMSEEKKTYGLGPSGGWEEKEMERVCCLLGGGCESGVGVRRLLRLQAALARTNVDR